VPTVFELCDVCLSDIFWEYTCIFIASFILALTYRCFVIWSFDYNNSSGSYKIIHDWCIAFDSYCCWKNNLEVFCWLL